MSRVVVETELVVAFTTPATDAPVRSSTAARNRNTATMCAPTVPTALEQPVEPSPTTPPRGRTHAASQCTALRRAETGVPAASPISSAAEQAQAARAERPHRGEHRPAARPGRRWRSAPPGPVVHGADQRPQPVQRPVAAVAAVPVQVDQAREEDAGRDQREPDQIQLSLFERRQSRPGHGRGTTARGLRFLAGGSRLAGPPSTRCVRRSCPGAPYHHSVEASDRPVRVLVVEDDDEIAQVLQRSLRLDGYEVKLAADGVQALDEAHAFLPDLIVLDLGLPRLDGIDVARRLRDDGDDVPILMLTARDALESRVEGLDVGADDYLVKPFERQELLARLRALLRRRPPRGMAPLRVGDLMLNPDTHEVTRAERQIDLTQREFELLEYLMRNERLVISRQKLLDEVWGYDPFSITNTIEVFVSNLRRKLEAGGEPRLLHTVRGAGYVLRV